MLTLVFALGRFWGRLAAFVVALGRLWCVLGRLGLDFGGFRGTPGRVFETQDVDFPWFFRDSELSMQQSS